MGFVVQRHPDRCCRGQIDQRRVGLERTPCVERLGPWFADRLQQLLGDADRAAADRNVVLRDGETVRDRLGQGCRAVFGGAAVAPPRTAAAMASDTDGRGPNGDSLEDSLTDLPSGPLTRRPGW